MITTMDYRWSFYCFDTFLGILEKKTSINTTVIFPDNIRAFGYKPVVREWTFSCDRHVALDSDVWNIRNKLCSFSASASTEKRKIRQRVCRVPPTETLYRNFLGVRHVHQWKLIKNTIVLMHICRWLINIIDILTLYERSVVGILLRCRTISEMILKN